MRAPIKQMTRGQLEAPEPQCPRVIGDDAVWVFGTGDAGEAAALPGPGRGGIYGQGASLVSAGEGRYGALVRVADLHDDVVTSRLTFLCDRH